MKDMKPLSPNMTDTHPLKLYHIFSFLNTKEIIELGANDLVGRTPKSGALVPSSIVAGEFYSILVSMKILPYIM